VSDDDVEQDDSAIEEEPLIPINIYEFAEAREIEEFIRASINSVSA
jgi:hypothetical protein